ncbi:sulfatase-like hydrolase/transferase [Labilithrix luteola]|uniref:sulfatase-like hydrolase/transferase n=1 Tax=Labilithrix luteola TaxID=1391654 RepID=UPI0011BAAED6|nr:sulfatase-like hydrolase/transferase [Labilithrix luteola]
MSAVLPTGDHEGAPSVGEAVERIGLRGFTRALRLWVPTSVWVAALVQTLFLVVLAATDGYDVARSGEVLRVILTYVTVAAMFGLVHLVVGVRSRLAVPITLAVFSLFVTVNIACEETAGNFDYAFVHANAREIFTPLGRHIVASNLKIGEVALLLFVPLTSGLALVTIPNRAWPGSVRSRWGAALVCTSLLVGLPAARVSTHEALTAFVVSALRFHAENSEAEASTRGMAYPYVHDLVPSPVAAAASAGDPAPRPDVILLFLESWNGVFTDKTRPDGRAYTPVFNARRRDGLSFEHFYGNSIQSSRGHFATLCSLIPLYRAKEFTDLGATRLRCLPEVLGGAGYKSLFYSATAEPEFDRSQIFFRRIGFDEALFQDPPQLSHDPDFWGTGLQDDVFYKRFFGLIDERIEREPSAPIFAVAANASNHYPFNERPNHVPDPHEATKYRRNYVASLSNSDAWLATFFDELDKRPRLRDAIVVAVGDHSFPADEHGIHINMLGSYEEAFRTAFVLRWRGHLEPRHVPDRAGSQIDIAPTIADLLKLSGKVAFAGRSLLDETRASEAAPLVQPYDGVQLVAVRYPFKLVRHEAAEQESLFDLSTDPAEEHDRIHDPRLASEREALRETITRIHANQSVLRGNRVWPE